MSKLTKAIERLKNKPLDLKWNEVKTVMTHFGYVELQGSGSRVKFYNSEKDTIANLHKPHNPNTLRNYQIERILERLEEDGFL